MTVLRSRIDQTGGLHGFFDGVTAESVATFLPCFFYDEFVYTAAIPTSASAGCPWIKATVETLGTPSVALVANSAGGVIALACDNTNEQQAAALYPNVFVWDINKGFVWEARVALHNVPVGTASIVWGVNDGFGADPTSADNFMYFGVNGSGVVSVYTHIDPASMATVATDVTMAADVYHVFRIDSTDSSNVIFQIDGETVTTVDMSDYTSGIVQPAFQVYKASGTDVGSIRVDSVTMGQNRS